MPERLISVITTIQAPTKSVQLLATRLASCANAELVIVGDTKGPLGDEYDVDGATMLTYEEQKHSEFDLASLLPTGHYARKNLGYLWAISRGASCIYETDDDNAPNAEWTVRHRHPKARCVSRQGWVNVYEYFLAELIWPRGFPLNSINVRGNLNASPTSGDVATVNAPIQQGLVDLSPDVDAVWRLVLDRKIVFERNSSVWLAPGAWCPFNSQSTWWWPDAFPLMYLPSYCSFRMTDIWRSLVAQRCIWELGHGLVFHASEVVQERNTHDLMRDFHDEIPGYERNTLLVEALSDLKLKAGEEHVPSNLLACYTRLVEEQFFAEEELQLVEAWLRDLERLNAVNLIPTP